jgi:hypothetical protein
MPKHVDFIGERHGDDQPFRVVASAVSWLVGYHDTRDAGASRLRCSYGTQSPSLVDASVANSLRNILTDC